MTFMSATQVILHVHVGRMIRDHTRVKSVKSHESHDNHDSHVTITWQSQPSDGNMRLHMTFNMTALFCASTVQEFTLARVTCLI